MKQACLNNNNSGADRYMNRLTATRLNDPRCFASLNPVFHIAGSHWMVICHYMHCVNQAFPSLILHVGYECVYILVIIMAADVDCK